MKVTARFIVLVATAIAPVGCGNSGPAEVPKNPVPMQKPGSGSNPSGDSGKGTGKGGALPNQQGLTPLNK